MVISVIEIPQDQEITVPFDEDSELPPFIDCACGQQNCPLMKANLKKENISSSDLLKQNTNIEIAQSQTKGEMHDNLHESENESLSEDSRHEKLSREERKLQALMKQFEKLERKQDATKHKTKEATKVTVLKGTGIINSDEQISNNIFSTKPPLAK